MSPQQSFPPQQQKPHGLESEMNPKPESRGEWYRGSGKLRDKIAVITGGDSGIGRSVAVFFAREGADVVVVYHNEDRDAEETKKLVEAEGRSCMLMAGDVGSGNFCKNVVGKVIETYGHIDILVNNAAYQALHAHIEDITDEELEKTFRTNIFSYFFMSRAVLAVAKSGAVIINTASVTAYRGSTRFPDYSSTKGAIVAFTRSLALMLVERGIRVNGVAPGPVWTPLIPSSFPGKDIPEFGASVPMGRAAQPEEIAPSYVFLASRDSSYMTGQIIHPNGGEIING